MSELHRNYTRSYLVIAEKFLVRFTLSNKITLKNPPLLSPLLCCKFRFWMELIKPQVLTWIFQIGLTSTLKRGLFTVQIICVFKFNVFLKLWAFSHFYFILNTTARLNLFCHNLSIVIMNCLICVLKKYFVCAV